MDPITTVLVSKAAEKSFDWLFGKLRGHVEDDVLSDETRTSMAAYYQRLAEDLQPVRMFHIKDPRLLEQIYVSLKIHREKRSPFMGWTPEHIEAFVRRMDQGDLRDRERLFDEATDRYEDTDVLKAGRKLVIVGKPGAGKTTFLKHLSVSYVSGQEKALSEEIGLLPVFVYLRELDRRADDMLDVLARNLGDLSLKPDTKSFLETCLEQGLCLLMLDGLDEVTDRKAYDKVVEDVKHISRAYGDNRIIVTSRPTGYSDQLAEDGFIKAEVEDMTPEQVEKFVDGWFAPDPIRSEEKARELKENLKALLEKDAGLRSLTSNPLMLSLLAIAYEYKWRLPTQRHQLFRDCVDALLERWDASRGFVRETRYEQLTTWRKQQLFYQIARKAHAEGRRIIEDRLLWEEIQEFFRGENLEIEDPQGVVKELETHHGIIVEHAPRLYAFSHLGLQEYFTAEYYATGDWKELLEHADDPAWEEVIKLYAAIPRTVDAFLGALMASDYKRRSHLSYLCLKSGARLSSSMRKEILMAINRGEDLSESYADVPGLLAGLPEPQRVEAGTYYLGQIKREELSYEMVRSVVTVIHIAKGIPHTGRKRYIDALRTQGRLAARSVAELFDLPEHSLRIELLDLTYGWAASMLGVHTLDLGRALDQNRALVSALVLARAQSSSLALARVLSLDHKRGLVQARIQALALAQVLSLHQDTDRIQNIVETGQETIEVAEQQFRKILNDTDHPEQAFHFLLDLALAIEIWNLTETGTQWLESMSEETESSTSGVSG